MGKTLQLEIATPDKLVLSEQVDYVGARGEEGDFGVLPGHIPMLAALSVGGLVYSVNGKHKKAFINGGVAEVLPEKVTILAESAELADCIDLARAKDAKNRAEKRLTGKKEDVNMHRASAALQRSLARIQVYDSR